MMKHIVLCALISLLTMFVLASPVLSTTEPDINNIHGLWIEKKKHKVAVWIEHCNDGLCGHIYWLKKPLSKKGLAKRDPNNPDAALRDRFLCGLKILSGFQHDKQNTWSDGEIYNPSDGHTFSSTIKLADDGSLKIRGYIGIPLFGKTLKWVRPQKNLQQCS